jgi:type I restriction enzyme R subunit
VDFWEYFQPEAREILQQILDKYIEHGTGGFTVPGILKVAPISTHGNVLEIAGKFGGPEQLRAAVDRLQTLLYSEES